MGIDKGKINPGSWHDTGNISDKAYVRGADTNDREEVEVRQDQMRAFDLFKQEFGYPEMVLYSGCGTDSTVAFAFQDARQIFCVDPNDIYISTLEKYLKDKSHDLYAKIQFLNQGTETIPYGNFDLVVSIHSQAPFNAEFDKIKPGGYLFICRKRSDYALDHSALRLLGVIDMTNSNEPQLITDKLDDYYEIDPDAPEITFGNRRRLQAEFYIFRKADRAN